MSCSAEKCHRFRAGGRTRFLVLVAAWFWLLVLPSRLPTPTLEPSWQAVLNFAAVHHLQHGVDIVFTYGPLGYLMQNSFCNGTWLRVLLFQGVSRALYVALVYDVARRAGKSAKCTKGSVLAFVAAALWLPALDADTFYLLFITIAGVVWCSDMMTPAHAVLDTGPAQEGFQIGVETAGTNAEAPAGTTSRQTRTGAGAVRRHLFGFGQFGPERLGHSHPGKGPLPVFAWGRTIPAVLGWMGIFMVALFGLIKTTFLGFGVMMLVCILVWSLWERRWRAIAPPAFFVVAFSFGWTVLGQQHFVNLGLWLRGTSETVSSYQQAMGLWPDQNQLLGGLLALLLVAAGLTMAVQRSLKSLAAVLLVLTGCILAWKQSFTRGDEYHARTFFVYILTAGTLVPVLFGSANNRVASVLLLGICLGSSLLCRLPIPLYRAFENVRFLARLPQRGELWARRAEEYNLPEMRAIIGRGSVDVTGGEQAMALLNGFNYCPAPVFQPYAAGTPYLAGLNAAFYRSDRAPDFIITHGYTIDDRLPNLDDCLSGRIIAERYRPVTSEKGFRLLRRVGPSRDDLETLISGQLTAGEPLRVSGGQWCEMVMQENWLGRLARLCWMSPPIYAQLQRTDGSVQRYRFVPSIARSGFVVPEQAASLSMMPSPAVRFCFRPLIRYRLSRVVMP